MKTISVIEIKEKEVHKGVSTINIRKIKKPKIFNNLDGDNVKYSIAEYDIVPIQQFQYTDSIDIEDKRLNACKGCTYYGGLTPKCLAPALTCP